MGLEPGNDVFYIRFGVGVEPFPCLRAICAAVQRGEFVFDRLRVGVVLAVVIAAAIFLCHRQTAPSVLRCRLKGHCAENQRK